MKSPLCLDSSCQVESPTLLLRTSSFFKTSSHITGTIIWCDWHFPQLKALHLSAPGYKKTFPRSSSELMDYRIGGPGSARVRLGYEQLGLLISFFGGERVFRRLVSASAWNWCNQRGVYKHLKKKKTLEDTPRSTCHDVDRNLTWGAAWLLKDIFMQK